jgi:chromodomain-helicase-DNA-binding protein 4
VVTPNSTCPNWRREIKKWAPDLRVVAYYGGKEARKMALDYELLPEGTSNMRAHVVVTSYEAPVSDTSFFKSIKWAGMIVDEGQRLKNDQNLLYTSLKKLRIPFQVLLTGEHFLHLIPNALTNECSSGTPLQNNKRELFNLLQFLNSKMNAAELDEEYKELTKENLPKLHALIRPYFLRYVYVRPGAYHLITMDRL